MHVFAAVPYAIVLVCVCVCVSLITLIWLAFSALSAVWLTFLAYAGDRNAEQWQGDGVGQGQVVGMGLACSSCCCH